MNKKLLTVLVVCTFLTIKSNAQNYPTFTHQADSVFQNLNKSGITTGILYDRVYPYAMLHLFNTSLADTSTTEHFLQSYYELYSAAYNPSSFTNPDTVDTRIQQQVQTGVVPIGILNYQFNQIDTNSIADNLISDVNGIYYDVPGRPRSPYWLKQFSEISPLADSAFGLQIIFKTSATLFFQNTGHAISSLQADFNNGAGLISIGTNNSVTVNYTTYGIKTIKFIIKYNDNSQCTTYAAFTVAQNGGPATKPIARHFRLSC